jgi:hypothetical protein
MGGPLTRAELRRKRIIFVVVLVVLAGFCGWGCVSAGAFASIVGLAHAFESHDDDKAIDTYFAALRTRDADAVYRALCTDTRKYYTRDQIAERLPHAYHVTRWSYSTGGHSYHHKDADGFEHHNRNVYLHDGDTEIGKIILDIAEENGQLKLCGPV